MQQLMSMVSLLTLPLHVILLILKKVQDNLCFISYFKTNYNMNGHSILILNNELNGTVHQN